MSDHLPDVQKALTDLEGLVEFAYEQGFHEMGYDPLTTVKHRIAELTEALQQREDQLRIALDEIRAASTTEGER